MTMRGVFLSVALLAPLTIVAQETNVTLVIAPGWRIIANQLVTTNNRIPQLFPNVPNGTAVLKWGGSAYLINQYDAELQEWADPNQTLSPGEGAFFLNPTSTNLTVVFRGTVMQGLVTNSLPRGFSLLSFKVPRAGLVSDYMCPPAPGDMVLTWRNGGFLSNIYDPVFGWDVEPFIAVGEGFFYYHVTAAPSTCIKVLPPP